MRGATIVRFIAPVRRSRTVRWMLVGAACASCLLASGARAEGMVRIPPEIALEDSELQLGRIAIIEDVTADTRERLSQLQLGPAAPARQVRTLAGAGLRARIVALAPDVALDIPDEVHITRLHREIAPDWVQSRVTQAIQLRMPWRDAEPKLSNWRLPPRFSVPANAVGMRVRFGPREDFQGRVSARLEFFDPALPEKTELARSVALEVELEIQVWAAKRDLRRGERPDAASLERVSLDPRRLPADVLSRTDLVLGQPLRVNVRRGSPLLLSYFDIPEVVRRGDPLEVRAGADGLEIRIAAKALQGGSLGEVIRAENPASRKSFPVRLTGPGSAELVGVGGSR